MQEGLYKVEFHTVHGTGSGILYAISGKLRGGMLYARDLLYGAGYVSMGFVALAVLVVTLTKPRQAPRSRA